MKTFLSLTLSFLTLNNMVLPTLKHSEVFSEQNLSHKKNVVFCTSQSRRKQKTEPLPILAFQLNLYPRSRVSTTDRHYPTVVPITIHPVDDLHLRTVQRHSKFLVNIINQARQGDSLYPPALSKGLLYPSGIDVGRYEWVWGAY